MVRFPRAIGARRRSHCGVALVEFALTLPLLAILVFGTVDLGRAYLTWVRVKNAAREGAAYAQTHAYQQTTAQCPDPDNVTARARYEIGDPALAVAVTPLAPQGSTCTTPSPPDIDVTVTASKPFQLLTPLVQGFVGNVTVRAAVTVRTQG